MTSSVDTSAASPMPLDSLTVTITAPRVLDGLVFASNTAKMSPEAYAEWLLTQDGHRFADANSYGVITSAAFFRRFTPTEYDAILTAAATNSEVQDLLDQVLDSPTVALDDPRLEPGLALLVNLGLLDTSRPEEILFYARPEQDVTE